jgi:hypothetical protein
VAGGRPAAADLLAERAGAGAVGERPVVEALRAQASDPDAAAGRRPGDPPAESTDRECDRQGQERDREPENDFGDS